MHITSAKIIFFLLLMENASFITWLDSCVFNMFNFILKSS